MWDLLRCCFKEHFKLWYDIFNFGQSHPQSKFFKIASDALYQRRIARLVNSAFCNWSDRYQRWLWILLINPIQDSAFITFFRSTIPFYCSFTNSKYLFHKCITVYFGRLACPKSTNRFYTTVAFDRAFSHWNRLSYSFFQNRTHVISQSFTAEWCIKQCDLTHPLLRCFLAM